MNTDFDQQIIDDAAEVMDELKPGKCRIHKDKLIRINEDLDIFNDDIFGGKWGESLSMIAKRFAEKYKHRQDTVISYAIINNKEYKVITGPHCQGFNDNIFWCDSMVLRDDYVIIKREEVDGKIIIPIHNVQKLVSKE